MGQLGSVPTFRDGLKKEYNITAGFDQTKKIQAKK